MAETEPAPVPLGARFRDALSVALLLHGGQRKKGTTVPYPAHLLAVTAVVLEHGGDEDQAIAALLHDAIEDAGADVRPVVARFGERVLAIVEACTDSDTQPKPPWRQRKEVYLDRVPQEREDALLVAMADKLANVRSIVSDFRQIGDRVWERFRGGKDGTLWYYRALADAFARRTRSPICHELERAVHELEDLSRGGSGA